MKKVISLTLCVMMLASILAIGVNAAVTEHKKEEIVNVYYRYDAENVDGADVDFVTSQLNSANGATAIVTDDGTGNDVLEFAWNGEGSDDKTRRYASYAIPDAHMITGWSSSDMNNFVLEVDVKPINNTGGFGMTLHKPVKRIGFFPSAFSTGEWTSIKVEWDMNVLTIYAKPQAADASAYTELVAGTDYYANQWTISPSSSMIGVDRIIADPDAYMSKYDAKNFLSAKYQIDNIKIGKIKRAAYKDETDNYNRLYQTEADFEYVFPTSLGAGNASYSFSNVWLPGARCGVSFDAVRTGGDRPVNIAYCSNSYDGSSRGINIFTGEQDVKYTYKINFNGAAIDKVVRKAEGAEAWEVLTAGVDYSAGSLHGAKQPYLKFNYLGEMYKDNPDNLAKYCGSNPALEDVDTVWTISNLQVSCGIAVSAMIEDLDNGSNVKVSAVGSPTGSSVAEDKFTVMVAAYTGDLMVAAGFAEIEYEGEADIALTHADYSDLTYKLFVWDNDENGAPLTNVLDITSWVE